MSEMLLSGSVSEAAMEAALKELQEQVIGRIDAKAFDDKFGVRWSKLEAMGVRLETLIDVYEKKASEDDVSGLFDEKQQARLLLARYDERRGTGRSKRQRRSDKVATPAESQTGGAGSSESPRHRRIDEGGHASVAIGQRREEGAPQEPETSCPAAHGWQS
ncbi:hypothetical protein [Bosea sp. (in: a-proteobacteria)]|uniref:hypothetical protein n=1 Tax=Bosea sp. (in: a-proteobacteria) TaxID=1871050 RepID=UPI003B3AE8F6